MLAAASRRAGWQAAALDLFADTDTRALGSCARVEAAGEGLRFDGWSLLAAARAPERRGLPLVAGTGFEEDTDLLAALAEGRPLLGNAPEVVRRVKDPFVLAETLRRLGVPHPPVARTNPGKGGWLRKRAGGSGGWHIRPAEDDALEGEMAEPGSYFQRRQTGEPVSLLFLADGTRALPVGFSAQWTCPAPESPFRYGGAAGPLVLPDWLSGLLSGWVARVTAAFGLRGLNAADFLVEGDRAWLVEVNPRPSATLEIFDRDPMPPLLALHAAACAGDLPDALPPLPGARAAGILYAERTMTVPDGLDWPNWTADRPGPGPIQAGAPVCTVTADGATSAAARTSLMDRMDGLRARLAGLFETETG
nr:ATP-grasp domain-containing protein [Azospirillum sp. SYSU D00513]